MNSIEKLKSCPVVVANELNISASRLTLIEQRLIRLAVAKIPSKGLESGVWLTVTATDLLTLGGNKKTVYQSMKQATERLYDRSVTININRAGTEGEARLATAQRIYVQKYPRRRRTVIKFRWLQACEYEEGEGQISLLFSDVIRPFLAPLKKEFTEYPVIELKNLSNAGTRLYGVLKQFNKTGYVEIGIDDLRKALDPEDMYPRFSNFNQRAIQSGIKSINKSPTTSILIEPPAFRKRGRSVTSVIFTFSPKNKNQKNYRLSKDQISMLADWLTGKNERINASGYKSTDFMEDLIRTDQVHSMTFTGATGNRKFHDWLKKKLADSSFVQRNFKWIERVGFKC